MFRILLLSLTAAIGGFLFGFDSGVINGTVSALQSAFGSSSVGTGFNVSSMLLGCAVGAFFAGTLADRFGRKPVMIATAMAFIVSAWGSGVSSGSFEFVMYRIIGGLAVGAASVLSPAYISEVAPARVRGSLSSLQQLMIVLGLFMAFLSNFLIAQAAGGAQDDLLGFPAWRWMFWVEILPAGIFLFSLLFIPESPRYLVGAGREDHAHRVLSSLTHPQDAHEKIREIKATLSADHKRRFSDLINKTKRRVHPVVWAGIGLAAFQQLVGINVVFYYGAVLWEAAGFTEENALLQNVITGMVNIISTLVAIALVDRVGRKPLLLIGSIGMTLTLGTLAFIFSQGTLGPEGNLVLVENMKLAALIIANLYVVFFGISWGPVMWVMLGEMFPNQYRGTALAVCGFVQWIANFSVTFTFQPILTGFGLGTAYGIYSFCALASIWFVATVIRETKGKSLEQME